MKQKLGRLCSSFLVLSLLVASGFTLISGKQVAYAATLTIEQNTIGNIFYESDTKSFKINTDGDSIDWVYSDYWDNTVKSGSQAVSGGSVLLTVNPGKMGWFKLVIKAKQNGNVIASQETSFAVVSNFDLSQVADSHFSVQTHAARTDLIAQDPAALLPIAKKMGVKYCGGLQSAAICTQLYDDLVLSYFGLNLFQKDGSPKNPTISVEFSLYRSSDYAGCNSGPHVRFSCI
ncbi:hypothetical protein [Paenibacillus phytorum]|uniref:hypothetical protein n=1 Tax=Paenibacillus phytorum TaxID=2654977 RepID=UPI001FEA2F80